MTLLEQLTSLDQEAQDMPQTDLVLNLRQPLVLAIRLVQRGVTPELERQICAMAQRIRARLFNVITDE